MKAENQIDELIMAGWRVVDSDFDPAAFKHWRFKAFDCLTAMLGPDHYYTKYFERFVKASHRTNILAAGGVLVAAKEQIKEMDCVASEPLSEPETRAPHDCKFGHNGGLGGARTPK
jgi:hypothetical protein